MNISTELKKFPFAEVSGYCNVPASPEICEILRKVVRKAYVEMSRRAATFLFNERPILTHDGGWALVSPSAYVKLLVAPEGSKIKVQHERSSECDLPQVVGKTDSGLIIMSHSIFDDGVLVGKFKAIRFVLPEKIAKPSDVNKIGIEIDGRAVPRLYQ